MRKSHLFTRTDFDNDQVSGLKIVRMDYTKMTRKYFRGVQVRTCIDPDFLLYVLAYIFRSNINYILQYVPGFYAGFRDPGGPLK